MERLVLKSKSKEDIRLIADVARKMGITVEYSFNEDIAMVEEPEALAEWERLSPEQQQGLLDAIDELDAGNGEDSEDIIREFRKKYE
ncbi:hypothetical protein AAEO56_02845 [Flavobacterium sp. DGU11]|uniref:Addiction module component n=1 Tax=Flavobacterium arundinis TaxID=3139143 RepID=A0ABU9HU01_9FLAO